MNNKLIPRDVMYGSSEKVWCKCSKCGYEWEAAIGERNNGRGCYQCKIKGSSLMEFASLFQKNYWGVCFKYIIDNIC